MEKICHFDKSNRSTPLLRWNIYLFKRVFSLLLICLIFACSSKPYEKEITQFREVCDEGGSYLLGLGGRNVKDFVPDKFVKNLKEKSPAVESWPPEIRDRAKSVIVKAEAYQQATSKKVPENKSKSMEKKLENAAALIESGNQIINVSGDLAGAILDFFKVTEQYKTK